MNYESWSNRQIAMAVAMVIEGVEFNENAEPLFAVDCFYGGADSHGCYVVWTGDFESEYFNPCNNPSDAWPIIAENKINITYHSDGDACAEVFCESTSDWISVVCKNPLRAAMICFLKIKDAEQ